MMQRLSLVLLLVVGLVFCVGCTSRSEVDALRERAIKAESEAESLRARLSTLAESEIAGAKVASPARERTVVLSKTTGVGKAMLDASHTVFGYTTPYCVTYRLAGATQESCKPAYHVGEPPFRAEGLREPPDMALPLNQLSEQVYRCWNPIRVGDPLPDCWR